MMVWRQVVVLICVVLHTSLHSAVVASEITQSSNGMCCSLYGVSATLILLFLQGLQLITHQNLPASYVGDSGFPPLPTTTTAPIDHPLENSEQKENFRPAPENVRLVLIPLKPVGSHVTQVDAAVDVIDVFQSSQAVSASKSAFATAVPLSTGHGDYESMAANGSLMSSHATLSSNDVGQSASVSSSEVRSGHGHLFNNPSSRSSGSVAGKFGPYPSGQSTTPNTTISSSGKPLRGGGSVSEIGIQYLSQSRFPTAGTYNKPDGDHGHARNTTSESARYLRPSGIMNTLLRGFHPQYSKPSGRPLPPRTNLVTQSPGSAISYCSGVVTLYPATSTVIVTATVLFNETITLSYNATTPAPVLITPLPACQTITSRCAASYKGKCPNVGPIIPPKIIPPHKPLTISTLLVTQKSPVIIHQGHAVGNLFGSPTTARLVPAPSSVNGQPAGSPQAQQTSDVGSPSSDMQIQSDGSSVSRSSDHGQASGNTTPQQESQLGNAPATVPKAVNAESQQTGTGLSGGEATGGEVAHGQASGDQASEGESSAAQSPGEQAKGVQSNGSEASESPVSGGRSSAGHNSWAQTSDEVDDVDEAASDGGSSTSGSAHDSTGTAQPDRSTSGHSKADQTSSESPPSDEFTSSSQNGDSGTISSPPDRKQFPSGVPSDKDGDSMDGNGGIQESIDTPANQQVPKAVTANGVPISIAPFAVIVGSRTINVGSPLTTVMVQGQNVVVQSSQIIVGGTTIPIEAAITPPPAISVKISDTPVVLQPDQLVIGSQSFRHGSSTDTAILGGQTYSWDADQLVGPGTTVAFPSANAFTAPAPRITAAGQVFSVYRSSLKAAGFTVALPNTPKASPFMYKGQRFLVNPSQLIAPDRSVTIPSSGKPTPFVYGGSTFSIDASQFIAASTTLSLSARSGVITYRGQELTIQSSQIACPSTIITLSAEPHSQVTAMPLAMTEGGLTFSLGPSAAVIASSTYSFLPGQTPATITSHGQAVVVGLDGVKIGTIKIPIPTIPPSYSVVTEGGLTLSLAPSKVVLSGHTNEVQSGMSPIKTIIDGQTINIGPHGVGLGTVTIPLPTPESSYQVVTDGDLTFSIASSEAVIKGSTFAIGPDVPATMAVDGRMFSIGPQRIHFPGTTIDLPSMTNRYEPGAVTAEGLTFFIGPTNVIIDSSDYPIGKGASAETIMVASHTIRLGADGIMLPSTTIPPEQIPSAITADGLIFSVDLSQAIINGSTYQIGNGAMAMTAVAGSQTMKLGTNGIVLPSTTIVPWSNMTKPAFNPVPGRTGASGATPPTGLPGSVSTGEERGLHNRAGTPLRSSLPVLLGTTVGAWMLVSLLL